MLKWILVGVIVLWVIAMWSLVGYVVWRGWGPYLRSKRQQKSRVAARVKSKQGRTEFDPVNWGTQITQKVLVFECEDGTERDYEVRDDLFDWVEVGDDGVLVYQGDLFVEFEARRPRHDPDRLYKKLTR